MGPAHESTDSTGCSGAPARIPVGVSSCLLGQAVRYDGGHKHDRYLTGVLGRYFEYVAWCPEALAGLGVPRPPIRLAGDPGAPRAVRVADASVDVTDALLAAARRATPEMGALRGYVFKRGSPSCGMERVKVYGTPGKSPRMGQGLFARAVMQAFPLLPCEEEGRLNDAPLRESFVERVFAYDRWRRAMAEGTAVYAVHRHWESIVEAAGVVKRECKDGVPYARFTVGPAGVDIGRMSDHCVVLDGRFANVRAKDIRYSL